MGFGYSFAQEDFRDLCSPVCGFLVYGERERERGRGHRIHLKIINHVNLKVNIIILHSCSKEPKWCVGYKTSLGF